MRDGERHPDSDPSVADGKAAIASGDTRPGPGAPEPVPGTADTMAAEPAVARTQLPPGDTRPGPGVPERPAPAKASPGVLETLPAAGPAETIVGSVAPPSQRVIRPPQHGQTAASDETIDAPAPHAATLQGPYTVADLPSLPRVDDDTYAIGAEIARGGMGKILAARDRRLRREVVIKVMRREFGRIDPRFEREALITARLQHPSIVRVYDAGVLGDGRAFYAMERVRGRSLEVVLAEATTLRERLALLPHAIAVCDALAYAHNEGIVHRDLKPGNILLGPFGETVVIDWGLAKDLKADEAEPDGLAGAGDTDEDHGPRASDSALTQHGAVMGTPAFMAPEQARGEVADERTDVYALGALIYTLLTGGPPVSGTSSDEVIDAVATGRRKHIGDVEADLPPELASIVERAMALERVDRYSTAKQLADDLRSFAAGKLVPSHEYSTWQLVRRWIARHRLPVGIAAVATVVLAVGTVVAIRNLRREKERAEAAQLKAENERDNLAIRQANGRKNNDPSLAAGWLKELSDRALGWDVTANIAQKIYENGLAHKLVGHRQDVELVASSVDGTHAATASDDSTVRWWDLGTRGSLELSGHIGPIDSMTLSGDGKYLATAGTDHKVILWTLATGGRRDLLGHTNTARGVAFSPDNAQLASTSEDGSLFLWNVATATGERLLQYTHSLRALTWFDGTTLLVGAFDGRIGRLDVTTRNLTWFDEHKAEIRSIAVSPDRKLWVSTDEDGQVTLWDATANKRIRDLAKHQDVAREAIITADGRYVVTAGGNYEIHVHTLPDGVFHALKGNKAGIKDIDLNRDNLVAAAGIDGAVRVWKLDGTLLHTWRGHRAAVKGVAFAGHHVVSASEDKTIRLWSLDQPPSPPRGVALRPWLDEQTNLTSREEAEGDAPD